ncbi:MAG: hypothetical protein E7292_07320 [Lachnospiraceae bacterium]|nr:hypothetical protein [Lachnospiraceae bacterium]
MSGKVCKLKRICRVLATMLPVFLLAACGYTDEEKQQMAQYEAQGQTNAINYIQDKYGIEATVLEVVCEKLDSGPVPDFSPAPTGDVCVTLQQGQREFKVIIAGDEVTKEGIDNYQLADIEDALEQKIYEITGLPSEELFVCFGEYQTMKDNKNGMIATCFDGDNLAEILDGQSPAVVVSYINQDVTGIDMEAVTEQTGIEDYLFVDYDSKAHYDTIESPYYNIAGSPVDFGIDNNLLYVNGYRIVDSAEDVYISCGKTVIDDIVLITEHADEYVSITKTTLDDAAEWNGHGFINAKQIFDAYTLNTDSDKVYIYVPKDKLGELGTAENAQTVLVKQYQYEDETEHKNIITEPTDDGKYIGGIIYMDDYTELKFSVFTDLGNTDK